MVWGFVWMIVSNIILRLLGVVYIIFWYVWMGENVKVVNGLFNMGYNIYVLFLLIFIVGIFVVIVK